MYFLSLWSNRILTQETWTYKNVSSVIDITFGPQKKLAIGLVRNNLRNIATK